MSYQLVNTNEYLEIDDVPLSTPAWEVLDLSPLWDAAAQRGEDRVIPGAPGVVAYPRRNTVTVVSLPLIIYGAGDPEGASVSDPRAQLFANIAELINDVVSPAGGDGTRDAVVHLPGGATLEGAVHVVGPLELRPFGPHVARGVLDLSIPAGRLVYTPAP